MRCCVEKGKSLVWDDENMLEVDSDDGCIAL